MKLKYCILPLLTVLYCHTITAQEANEYITRGKALTDRALYSQAISLYTEGMNKYEDYRLLVGRGEAYLISGQTGAAIKDFSAANGLVSGSGYHGLARAYITENDFEKAVSCLRHHLESEFKIPRRDILTDPAFAKLENTDEWRQLWNTDWYTRLDEAVSEVEYYIRTGKIADGEAVLSEVENIYSEKPEIMYLKGLIESARNNTSESIQYLAEAVNTDNPDYAVWKLYIDLLDRNGDNLRAANECDNALSWYPEQTELIYLKAENLRRANDREKAMEVSMQYLDLYPDGELANRQAGLIAGDLGEYTRALNYFSKNIENYPGKAQCFTDRADIYLKIKSYDAAIYDYSMALDLWPRDSEAYYRKGLALINTGNKEEACHDFMMALRFGNKKASAMISKHCIR